MKLIRKILTLMLMFFGCNSPSDSMGSLVVKSALYPTDNYCYDIDLNDDTIVLASYYGGYYKYSYELGLDGFPIITPVIEGANNHNLDLYNDSIDKVEILNDGLIYMLDRHFGGSSGVWIDNSNGAPVSPENLSAQYCVQGNYLDIAVDDSRELVHDLYSLMKHTSYDETNSSDPVFKEYSTSLVKREVAVIADYNGDVISSVDLVVPDCTFLKTLNYDSSDVECFGEKVAVVSESEGITVFEKDDGGDLVNLFQQESAFKINLAGGQAQSVLVIEDAVIGGFSNDRGCYMALLGSDSASTVNLFFGEGYSVRDIAYDNGLIALASGSDGIQIYQWDGGDSVIPFGSIETDYAYSVKLKGSLVFVATRLGLEIYKIGI